MKYTIFTHFETCFINSGNYAVVLDYAKDLALKGNDITLVYCEGSPINTCHLNMTSNNKICRYCNLYKKNLFQLLPKSIKLLSLTEYTNSIQNNYPLYFNSIDELKSLEYKHVGIGYAALSTYLTLSRNLFPELNSEFKLYISKLLKTCCQYTDAVEQIITDTSPDIIACYNSRFIYARPIIDMACYYDIKHISYETAYDSHGNRMKISYNTTPHNVDENTEKIEQLWASDRISRMEKIEMAEQFFYKRKNSIYTGDKLYVKEQCMGQLPTNWNTQEHNVLILNSSEDEFAALGEEFENKSLFHSQYEAIEFMINRYKEEKNIHFYLRVHPNLKKITYQYHIGLYSLFNDSNNFTIIPADSTISTYSLIDHCDKVIVFGSTTGPEAVYWGKPTILLSYCLYSKLNICYIPKNIFEMDQLIKDTKLPAKDKIGALKYGYFRLNDEYDAYLYYKHQIKHINIVKYHFDICMYQIRIINRLFAIIIQILGKRLYYKHFSIPLKEKI